MKMFKKKVEAKPPVKRSVVTYGPASGWTYLDRALEAVLKTADITEDADEIIACLNDSPRFKKNVQAEAERRMGERLKELEAAVEAFKKAAAE